VGRVRGEGHRSTSFATPSFFLGKEVSSCCPFPRHPDRLTRSTRPRIKEGALRGKCRCSKAKSSKLDSRIFKFEKRKVSNHKESHRILKWRRCSFHPHTLPLASLLPFHLNGLASPPITNKMMMHGRGLTRGFLAVCQQRVAAPAASKNVGLYTTSSFAGGKKVRVLVAFSFYVFL